MSSQKGSLNLALALEGKINAARENEMLVTIAKAVADLPDPEIDKNFMLALEQRLLTEGLEEQSAPAGRHLSVVPTEAPAPAEPVRRAAVVQMPKRRYSMRRGIAAVTVAASLAALPAVAAAQALPGSPFYGLKTRIERVQLAMFGTPVEDAMRHLDLANRRISEAVQLSRLQAEPSLIDGAFGAAEEHIRTAEALVLEHATDEATVRTLGERAAEAEMRLREVRDQVATSSQALDSAIGATVEVQQRVDEALGVTTDATEIENSIKATEPTKAIESTTSTKPSNAGTPKHDGGSKKADDTPDATKELDEAPEGCQVIGSGDGLGDTLAPVSRVICS